MNMKKILVSLFAGLVGVTALTVSSIAADTDIFEVGADKNLKTWSEAVDAAKDEDGDGEITYHIYGKVEVDKVGWVSPKGTSGATTVNLIGKTTDAEISISQTEATIIVTDVEKVNYKDLILSKTNGFTAYDYGHANNYFTTWITSANALVTYEDCVFPNGSSNNQYGKTTYTDCTFNNPVEYALWIYGGEVVVTGGTFEAKKGVKTFSEGNAEITTTISGATFDIESKPAIVSSSIGTLTISDVNADACKYGLLTSEAHGHNVANGLADITVDGEAPVYAAIVNGEYHSSLEYAREEDRGEIETPVARIGSKYFGSLEGAIAAADDGAEIILLNDITLDELKIKEKTFTLNLNGNTLYIADSDADKCTRINHINGANVTYKNGTINIDDANDSVAIFGWNVYEGTVAATVTFDNVVVEGDGYNSGYAVFYLNAIAGNKMVVTNSEIYLANEKGASGGVFKAENKDIVLEISLLFHLSTNGYLFLVHAF